LRGTSSRRLSARWRSRRDRRNVAVPTSPSARRIAPVAVPAYSEVRLLPKRSASRAAQTAAEAMSHLDFIVRRSRSPSCFVSSDGHRDTTVARLDCRLASRSPFPGNAPGAEPPPSSPGLGRACHSLRRVLLSRLQLLSPAVRALVAAAGTLARPLTDGELLAVADGEMDHIRKGCESADLVRHPVDVSAGQTPLPMGRPNGTRTHNPRIKRGHDAVDTALSRLQNSRWGGQVTPPTHMN
jgi:hypothetical protein